MLIEAKTARPVAARGYIHRRVFETHLDDELLLVQGSAGCLLAESLAALFQERQRPVIWLRFGTEDRDPARCLLTLIGALENHHAGLGQETLRCMRTQPGWLCGWSRLYAQFSDDIRNQISRPVTIVLQNIHILGNASLSLRLLIEQWVNILPDHILVILHSHDRLPSRILTKPCHLIDEKDLYLDRELISELLDKSGGMHGDHLLEKVALVSGGKAVPLLLFSRICSEFGKQYLNRHLSGTNQLCQALYQILSDYLAGCEPPSIQALTILTCLGYFHPDLTRSFFGCDVSVSGPWSARLEGDWLRLSHILRDPLIQALRTHRIACEGVLRSSADHLCDHLALAMGVYLYKQAGRMDLAAVKIAEQLPEIMGLGMVQTLENWLQEIPSTWISQQPWLCYAQGEIHSMRGYTSFAIQAFEQAVKGFHRLGESDGLCMSLVALSALAAWMDNPRQAWGYASKARRIICSTSLQGWAEYQLAYLAFQTGDSDLAGQHIASAIELIQDPIVQTRLHTTQDLITQRQNLRKQVRQHKHALQDIEIMQEQINTQIGSMLDKPSEDLLASSDWAHLPLMIKCPNFPKISANRGVTTSARLLQAFSGMLGRLREKTEKLLLKHQGSIYSEMDAFDDLADVRIEPPRAVPQPEASLILPAVPVEPATPQPVMLADQRTVQYAESQIQILDSTLTLAAHMLGTFRVTVNDQPVEYVPGGRGGALFKYLLYHHHQCTAREVLMEAFWPEADPQAARNRLNVALYQARRALRTVSDLPLLVFEDGRYGIRQDVQVWLDVEAFECNLREAQAYRRADAIAQAIASLETAASIYQGDFLAEDPYEEWAVLIRERLRLAHLEALDNLSRDYYQQGKYSACAALCQRILERDNCREDAHCLLMRCYGRMNQFHLALRQYQVCTETLRRELDVDPALSTMQLYQRMRRREITRPRIST